MAAPPWRQALHTHLKVQHKTHSSKIKNIPSLTNTLSPFHSKIYLCVYEREINITLQKIIRTPTPIYFKIELHKGIPIIAYYVPNFKHSSIQKKSTPHFQEVIMTHLWIVQL